MFINLNDIYMGKARIGRLDQNRFKNYIKCILYDFKCFENCSELTRKTICILILSIKGRLIIKI
jgi:hypothetical protein